MEGINLCWVEEANLVSKKSIDILIPTIREEGSEIWFSFNTGSETDEVYDRFITHKHPDAIVVKVNYYDNPWFPDVLRRDMEVDRETDYRKYLHVWEGEPGTEGILVWGRWDELVRRAYTKRIFPITGITLDHGHAHDTGVIFWRYDPYTPMLYIWDEYYKSGAYPPDHAPEIWSRLLGKKPDIQIADSAIFNDTGKDKDKPSINDEYLNLGFDFEPCGAKRMEGHQLIRVGVWIDNGWIQVAPKCTITHRECSQYSYDDKGKPVDENNEGPDCLKYTVERLERTMRPVDEPDIEMFKLAEKKAGWQSKEDRKEEKRTMIKKFWGS